MEKGIELWKKVLTTAMQLPGVKVNRDSFLKKELVIYCSDIQLAEILAKGTIGVIPIEILDKIASECISYHVKLVTASSTALGIPGGFTMLGTIPGDLAQYYYHVFVLAQKLSYIYGYPDLCDENGNFTEDAAEMLTIFVGVMGGVAAANKVISERGIKKTSSIRTNKRRLVSTYKADSQMGRYKPHETKFFKRCEQVSTHNWWYRFWWVNICDI